MSATFRITPIEWGNGGHPFSLLTLSTDRDPRRVEFHGDAFWQWRDTPFRNREANVCWAQLLFESLPEAEANALRSGDEVVVRPDDPAYARVVRLWDLVQRPKSEAIAHLKRHGIPAQRRDPHAV